MYARGWLEIADAPAVEAGIARWFEVAAALATREEGLPSPGDLEVTSVALLHRPGAGVSPVSYAEQLMPRRVASVDISPERLVLPPSYTETRWPGFGWPAGAPAPRDTAAERWRAIEDTDRQYARSVWKQAWLRERLGGIGPDTGVAVRRLDRRADLR